MAADRKRDSKSLANATFLLWEELRRQDFNKMEAAGFFLGLANEALNREVA